MTYDPQTTTDEKPLKAWEEEVLAPGAKVFFRAMSPQYGSAEFEFCHVFKRGKLQTVYVYPKQQEVPNIYYRIDCHGRSEFCIGSWSHKGIDEPRVWRQFYCRDHKGFVMNVYVPKNANHFVVGYGDIHFDMEIANAE